MKTSRVRLVLLLLQLVVLAACSLFTPPYAFNNPHDPQNAWTLKGSLGVAYKADLSGIPTISDLTVTADGSTLVAVSGGPQGGLWEITTATGHATHFGTSTDPSFNAVCVDGSGSTIYGISGGSVYAVDRASHVFKTIYTLDVPGSNFSDIDIDAGGTLCVAENVGGGCVIQRMSTAGAILGTITSPYLQVVQTIAVSDTSLFICDGSHNCVLALDKATGETTGEIYWDGSAWHNIVLAGGAPIVGNGNPQRVTYNRARSRLYASFWGDNAPVGVFDPSNLASPRVASLGVPADFSSTWDIGIAVDDAGTVYASDPRLTFVKNLTTGVTAYTNGPRVPGEFQSIADMHLGKSGTMYYVDSNLWQVESRTPDGQFHLIGAPGSGTGGLWSPRAVTEKNGEVYCGIDGGAWKVLHYGADGSFLDESSLSGEGSPLRMATLADGRILVWANRGIPGFAFYTYTTSPWALAGGPYTPDPRFTNARDVHLCLFSDGRMYCTVCSNTEASVGYLSDDLSTYTEIWNAGSDPVFTGANLGGDRFITTGISEAPAGDIWIGFRGLSAVVRFSTTGVVFASFSTYSDYQGKRWTPGAIVAYSLDANGNWQGPMQRLMCVDTARNIHVVYDFWDPPILEYSPQVSLP